MKAEGRLHTVDFGDARVGKERKVGAGAGAEFDNQTGGGSEEGRDDGLFVTGGTTS